MAEWSKAPDSRIISLLRYGVECSGPRMWAWVRIPLLTTFIRLKCNLVTARNARVSELS